MLHWEGNAIRHFIPILTCLSPPSSLGKQAISSPFLAQNSPFGVLPSLNITSILKLFSLYTILLGRTPTFAFQISSWGLIEIDSTGFSVYPYLPIMSSQTGEFGRSIGQFISNFCIMCLIPTPHACREDVYSLPCAKGPLLPPVVSGGGDGMDVGSLQLSSCV